MCLRPAEATSAVTVQSAGPRPAAHGCCWWSCRGLLRSWSASSAGCFWVMRHDCRARAESGAKDAVGKIVAIADGGYRGTGLVIPHRRRSADEELPDWKQAHNKSHKQVRARVEHVFARMKAWKILRDCRLRGDGVHHAMRGIARLHNLNLAG